MGSKSRYLVFVLFFFHPALNAQEKLDFKYVDSLTYSFYENGEWNKLISLGQSAIDNNIDYKYLRQRIGYAFFTQGNYYDSKLQFEKALTFDSYDQFSLEYLYYSYLNTGKGEYAGVIERRLNPDLRETLSINAIKVLESIELEYNFKYATAVTRSNPQYYRVGINSKLGYRFSLYQSYSGFYQVISLQQMGGIKENPYKQPEYYALLKYNVTNSLLVKTAYHFIQTTSGVSVTYGNLFLFAVVKDLNRFSFELNGSLLNIDQEFEYQAGVQTGYTFPGRSGFYLKGTLSGILQQDDNRLIYDQKAGFKLMKKTWLEGYITFGRMTGYNDYNGLYVYNTYDPMTFRCGTTIYLPLNRNITLWGNFSYETKEYLENSSFNYNQFSYLGGIKWKL
jgi:hypothetical protein